MKPSPPSSRTYLGSKGSALLTVVIFVGVMFVLTGSLLHYTVTERRANERNRLILRSRNMAENVAIYASEQLTTKLRRLRSPSPMGFVTGSNQIYLPPHDILATENSTPSDVEVKAGLTSNTGLLYIDPAKYPNDPNKGLQVDTATVQIIAKSTMRNQATGAVTTYVEQDLAVDLTPLFQFGVFYNMDMEYAPGPNMTISGPVHTNGNLIARIQTGKITTLTFEDRVTAVGGFFAHTAYKGSTWMANDTEDSGPGGSGGASGLKFTRASGGTEDIYDSSASIWRDHFHTGSSGTSASTPSATSLAKFESFVTSTYGGNLRTSVHQVPELKLPAVGSYNETTAPTAGRELIDEPYKTSVPTLAVLGDSSELALTKISRTAGLYIVVNPDDEIRMGKYPDGSQITMLPRSYRCFLTFRDSSGTHHWKEVVLPGQPSYGYNNNGTPAISGDDSMYKNELPNRFTDQTAIGSNQVLCIPASGRIEDTPVAAFVTGTTATGYATEPVTGTASYSNIPDAVFYDTRRATNNTGHPWDRAASNYIMRPIAKIDFDLTRFRLAVERAVLGQSQSSPIYYPGLPSAGWGQSVFNPAATTQKYELGVNYGPITDFSGFPDNTTATALYYADPFRIYLAPTGASDSATVPNPNTSHALTTVDFVNTASASPWSDGISIYLHSIGAENHSNIATGTPDRIDSAVRLWNGRGPVISLPKAAYPKRTGFTFATNDTGYIVGHFNADGNINTNSDDSIIFGGYSARYADSANEMLAAFMADAITILSQPVFTTNGSGAYYQTDGWADSFSAHRPYLTGSYSSNWFKENPSNDNPVDGISDSIKAAALPYNSDIVRNPGDAAATERNVKFDPVPTEISSCLVTGIVRTTTKQTSGGVHNFPRLLEYWPAHSGTALVIRGSMVALYESQVGIEPWSIRAYQGAVRLWGLHQALRNADHDVPLEPIVIGAHRLRYLELTPSQYATTTKTLEDLPK